MSALELQYREYKTLHHNFSVTFANLHKRVVEFWPVPQKLFDDTDQQLNNYLKKFSLRNTPPNEKGAATHVVFFSNSVKDFASSTAILFDEYNGVKAESEAYIKKIFKLKENILTNDETEKRECNELIPELTSLVDRLKKVEQGAEAAQKRMKKLQADWQSIKHIKD